MLYTTLTLYLNAYYITAVVRHDIILDVNKAVGVKRVANGFRV